MENYKLNDWILTPYDLMVYIPELWLSITVLILLVYVVLPGTRKIGQWAQIKDIDNISIGILIITSLLIWNQLDICLNYKIAIIGFNGLIKIDSVILFIKGICIISSMIVIWISKEFNAQEKLARIGQNIIILLGNLGILLLVSSNDLLMLYLAIELQSLSFYTLATLKRDEESSTEAGLKYFVLGGLSSGILLFGISWLYGITGLTNLDSLSLLLFKIENSMGLLIGILFIGVALLFKLAAAPFHMWVPDVYQGSPTTITAYFAIVPKFAIIGIFLRLFWETFMGLILSWQPLIIFSAIASMLIGSLGALNQSLLKRFFAYSAISHIGYILISLISGTNSSLQALLVYLIIYTIMSIHSFSILLCLRKKLNGKPLNYLIELVGLSRSHPLLAISFSISLLSLAGIPPLAGFFSKWLVFSTAIQSEYYTLAIVGVLTSVLAAVYYLRIIINLYARYPVGDLVSWTSWDSTEGGDKLSLKSSAFAGGNLLDKNVKDYKVDMREPYISNNLEERRNEGVNLHKKDVGKIFNFNILFNILNPLLIIDYSKSIILGVTTFIILFILVNPSPLLLITHELALNFYL